MLGDDDSSHVVISASDETNWSDRLLHLVDMSIYFIYWIDTENKCGVFYASIYIYVNIVKNSVLILSMGKYLQIIESSLIQKWKPVDKVELRVTDERLIGFSLSKLSRFESLGWAVI